MHTIVILHSTSVKFNSSSYAFCMIVYFWLPVLCIVGEAEREAVSRSRKLSGAGGGRLFRDLDLLVEYMFSSSAYTADSLYGEKCTERPE